MKRFNNIILVAFTLFMSIWFTSCDTKFDELTSINFDRVFQPLNFQVTTVKTQCNFQWQESTDAKSYTLQLSQDSLFATSQVDTTIIGHAFSMELAGETTYFARIRANAADSLKNSKFNVPLKFKTPKENLFFGFTTQMWDYQTAQVKWTPNANVTKLEFTNANGVVSEYPITSDEAIAGVKVVNGLLSSQYSIQIYNNAFVRGKTSVLIEGDIYVPQGGDLASVLAAATTGQVIVLASGSNFSTGFATFRIGTGIKIKGASPISKSIISMTATGTTTPPTATSSMLGFVATSTISTVAFENIDFTGYVDNVSTNVKIGYLFNNNVATKVGKLSFNNCNLRNFGNTPMRLQGGTGQSIDTLVINNSRVFDIGFSSTYAIINSNSADLVNNIYLTNSTFYNFKGSLILRTGQSLSSINITNCTINQGMQDASQARYLFDLNTAAFNNGGGVTIKNCIFGQSGGALGANGFRGTVTPTITGSYFTSDYVDDPLTVVTSTSIKGKLSAYSKLSTDLWTDPKMVLSGTIYTGGGNFTLKDATFAGKGVAGDLSWY